MIIDVYKNYVFDYLDLLSQIRLLATCWTLRNGLDITDMYNIDEKYKKLMTQSIIDKYTNLEKLDASNNHKITTVSHLAKLEILNAQYICGINDVGIINCINLKSLNVSNNSKITNVNHLVKLEILDASGECEINDAGIMQCINLKSLNISENTNIVNVNHLVKLEILEALGYCRITHAGIKNCIKLETINGKKYKNNKCK